MRLDAAAPGAIDRAAGALAAGELVALPTETVYGLGARADSDAAVAKIYAAKGRPAGHPLIVHVADTAAAAPFAAAWPDAAQRLAAAFWPGPLTVVVPRRAGIAAAAGGGQGTIALRCPAHPVAQALLRAAAARGVAGVAAPSANRFGRVSPTRAAHVVDEFGDTLLVLDGGACAVGIESVIVDCSRGRAVLLRPGLLTRGVLDAVLGMPLLNRDAGAPRASGTLDAHYAPAAPVRLMAPAMLHNALQWLGAGEIGLAVYSRAAPPPGASVHHRRMPDTAAAVAHELFAVLRDFDHRGVRLIWVEQPPDSADWDGVRDRLQRAAAA